MYVPEKLEEAKRRRGFEGKREKGNAGGLKLLRIGKIFELPWQSNYELCGTKPTLWRCARAFAHTGTPSSPQWESRETRNFRGVLSSGRARMAGRMDRWMDGWMGARMHA